MARALVNGIDGTDLGQALQLVMGSADILPGDNPSYQTCKNIYIYHPLGGKMAEAPVRLAQSQERKISIPGGPEEAVLEAFLDTREELDVDNIILNTVSQSRMYGLASVIAGSKKIPPDKEFNPKDFAEDDTLFFNVLDPLNTPGLVTDQDPNSATFQKPMDLIVQGQRYHRSRSCTVMNENSLYIAWSTSAFAFSGRSVYQRALYPLKTFLQSMVTDDMVTRKAGLLIAKMESPGSIIDRIMQGAYALKRTLLQQGETNNVLSIGVTEGIETLNMRNVDNAITAVRDNVIKNIASAADMPAKLLTQESFVLGFGEGTQDAYAIAQYIARMRKEMRPLYAWFDRICMYRAWTEAFYKTIQVRYPEEYADVPYEAAFFKWKNSFRADWPDLIEEKPSDLVNVDEIRMKSVLAIVGFLAPMMDPVNKAIVVQWLCDQVNSQENLFGSAALDLDLDEWKADLEQQRKDMQDLANGMGNGMEDDETKPKVEGFSLLQGGRSDSLDAEAAIATLSTILGQRRSSVHRGRAAH